MASNVLLIAAFVLLLAVYMEYPPPAFSQELTSWSNKGKFMVLFGQRVFYVDETSKDDSLNGVVLCLHGFLMSSYDWHKMWPHLKKNFKRLIAVDLPGHGLSDKPCKEGMYSIKHQAQVVGSLLKELKITDVHILTHDLGVSIASELLSNFNNFREKYSISRASVCALNSNKVSINFFQKIIGQSVLGRVVCRILNFHVFKYFFLGHLQWKISPEHLFDIWALTTFRNGHLILPELLQEIDGDGAKAKWFDNFRQTSIPVKLLYGPANSFNSKDFIPNLSNRHPDADVTLLPDHVGHSPHLQVPQLVLHHFSQFIRKIQLDTSATSE